MPIRRKFGIVWSNVKYKIYIRWSIVIEYYIILKVSFRILNYITINIQRLGLGLKKHYNMPIKYIRVYRLYNNLFVQRMLSAILRPFMMNFYINKTEGNNNKKERKINASGKS